MLSLVSLMLEKNLVTESLKERALDFHSELASVTACRRPKHSREHRQRECGDGCAKRAEAAAVVPDWRHCSRQHRCQSPGGNLISSLPVPASR